MSLHVEVVGQGESLVMLHGWGMHGGIWSDTATQLAKHFRVHCVDLPGHGESALNGEFTMDSVIGELSTHFEHPVIVCGWSLGGQIALYWAMREPEKVKRLILVTSTPSFTERSDWQFGISQEVLLQFSNELERNHTVTLRRFLGLQLRGSDGERELLSNLREQLFSRGEPNIIALRGGLAILRDSDLRHVLPTIMQSTLVIAGERDRLSFPEASIYMAQKLLNAHLVIIMGAAHTPFMSHRIEFVGQITKFLYGQN